VRILKISPEKLKEIVLEVFDLFPESDEEEDSGFLDENLFLTDHGKEFFDGVRNTYEFVSKGVILTAILDFYSMMPKIFDTFSGDDFLNTSKIKKEEKELIEIMNKLSSHPEIQDQLETTGLFDSGDIPRFVSSLVFSVYSYCEVFINNLVERVFENPEFAWKYIEYLENTRKSARLTFKTIDLIEYKTNPKTYASTKGKKIFYQNERGNPFSRQQTLLRVLEIEAVLKRVFHELDEPDFIKEFEKFKDLRNSIAHGRPVPELSHLKTEEVNQRIKKTINELRQNSQLDPADSIKKEALPKFDALFSEIKDSIIPIISPITIIQDIVENATILPAILERVIEFNRK
jgi:hypothetical protein